MKPIFINEVEPYRSKKSKSTNRKALYKCQCGTEFIAQVSHVNNGHNQTCNSCYIERQRKRNFKHGFRRHQLYILFHDIRSRCYYPDNESYHNYGGRGISMCVEWKDNPAAFCEWAMNNGWQKGLHIDRINNDGNYEPDNCRFVTAKINCRNSRNNVRITYNNETMCIKEMAEKYKINYNTLQSRLHCGWTIEKAIIHPIRTKHHGK